MRKLVLLLLVFSMSLQAQEKLSEKEKERREKNIQSGNPFKKFGYKAKVATLSNGKYLEFHDLDSIVTIGTVRWNVNKNLIVGRIVHDSLNPDTQPIGDRAGRWMSPDPLSEEFPDYSPYTFVENNPLRLVDFDGRAPTDIVILGANKSSVTVKTDLIDVKINASGLGIDFGGNYSFTGNDILQAVVDIGGVFDPTPTLDIFGAKLSASRGDYWGMGVSLLGAGLPYAGDLAKGPKIAKGLDKISDAIDAAKKGLKINVGDASKIERKLLDPPSKHGNAPTFKKDGSSVEIHHEGQNPNGPFKEMHKNDHRGKGNDAVNHPNKSKPSQIDRKEFNKAKTQYWKEQYPKQ